MRPLLSHLQLVVCTHLRTKLTSLITFILVIVNFYYFQQCGILKKQLSSSYYKHLFHGHFN